MEDQCRHRLLGAAHDLRDRWQTVRRHSDGAEPGVENAACPHPGTAGDAPPDDDVRVRIIAVSPTCHVMARARAREEINDLILRSPRSGRLEGWQQARASMQPSFETRPFGRPQDEVTVTGRSAFVAVQIESNVP